MALFEDSVVTGPGKRGTKIILREFRWPVLSGGYRLAKVDRVDLPGLDVSNLDGWVTTITPAPEGGSSVPARWYAPLREVPALFRTFADTPITGDGVLGFANRFGMLGGSATGEVHPPESADPTEVGLVVACDEPLAEWADRVLSMRFAVSLWDLASSNNQNGLRDVIHADSAGIWFRPNPAWLRPDWRVAVAKKGGVKWPSWFEAERIRATKPFLISDKPTALEGFQKFGDIARAEAALVAMEAIADRFLRRAVSHRLCVDVEFRAPYIFQEPDSLGSALWLQFAEAITSGTRIRQCKECGEWFALPKRGARITREFCTDACRVRAHRRRQDRARVLSSRGNDPKDIARELDTTAAIVRRWLKTGKGK